jgi:hypothetical protein
LVEVRFVAEVEGRVSRLELVRALEEADDIAVLSVFVRGCSTSGESGNDWDLKGLSL